MKDIEILKQLLNGQHLNEKELQRAKQLLHLMNIDIKNRIL